MAGLPLPTPPLADDAIVLRPWRETDIAAQLRTFSDPVFQAFSDWAPRTEAEARHSLVEYEAARQRGEQAEFALGRRDAPRSATGLRLKCVATVRHTCPSTAAGGTP
jgi:hypothetical protein